MTDKQGTTPVKTTECQETVKQFEKEMRKHFTKIPKSMALLESVLAIFKLVIE